MDEFRLFSGQIEDSMSISKVNKGVSIKAEVTCQNETDFVLSASLVEFDQVFSIVIVKNNNAFEVFRDEIDVI